MYLEDLWNWERSFPVIRLDFAESNIESRKRLDERFNPMRELQVNEYGIVLKCQHPDDRLEELILVLYHKQGEHVVVLVDEYDKNLRGRMST